MQGENHHDKATTTMRRHGLLGWFQADKNAVRSTPTAPELQTALPVFTAGAENFQMACTTGSSPLPDGGAVSIAGRPRFRDSSLAATAQAEGAAAAVAKAYLQHGSGLFNHVFGAFAICVIDNTAGKLLAGIDRLGQYALYYHQDSDRLLISSEARGALPADVRDTRLAEQGIYNYVYFHMVPSPGSVYPGVKKLSAAHFIEFDYSGLKQRKYWQPQFSEDAQGKRFEAMGEELKSTLREAVRNSVPDEGKTGAFLSGGLDSSTVTGFMAEVCDSSAEAYSIGFAAEGYDEMAFARITAKHFGVQLNEYYVTPEDVVDALPVVATSYDEPFGNSSALPAYFCARMAADNGVQTLLAGDGGDELFAGNERYLRQRVFDHYARIPGVFRKGLIEPVARLLPATLPLVSKARSYIQQGNTPLPDRLQSYNFLNRHAAEEIFSTDFLASVDTEEPLEIQRAVYHGPETASDLNRMLYLDWQITLADNDLRKVSHMCALAGVDVTYPMLDDDLLALSCNVPGDWKIRGQDLRHFYKRALDNWLPQETINKTKQGFGLPFGVWMRSYAPLREMAYDHMLKLKQRDFIRPEFIDRAIEMHQSEHAAYYGELVWILTVFELWLEAKSESELDVTSA